MEEGKYEGPDRLLDNLVAISVAFVNQGQLARQSSCPPVHRFYSVLLSSPQGLCMIGEWASNIDPLPDRFIVVI